MTLKLAFVSVFLNSIALFTFGQETTVIGKITNEQDVLVSEASIQLGQQNARSNSKGVFTIRINPNSLPSQLTIKHSLYKNHQEIVRAPIHTSDTLFLTIVMKDKVTELEEVTVSSSQIIWAYQKKNTHIIDYLLIGEEMLFACKENQNYYLRRLDSEGSKVVDVPIKNNPLNLFEDCMGSFYLVYADSMFELKFIGNSIGMFPGVTVEEAMRILSPCEIFSENLFIVKTMESHNQRLVYTQINRITKNPTRLYQTTDFKQVRSLNEYAKENDIVAQNSEGTPNKMNIQDVEELKVYRRKWNNQQLYAQILSKPLYAPIFEIKDSIFIFDHFKDSAFVFSISGKLIRTFQISYHYFENWKNTLYLNEEKTKLYAKYENDGLVTLRQIDPSTGKVIQLTTLEKHIYPLRIEIRDNHAYYIYKHYLDTSIHYLYKQVLKE